MRKRRDQGKGGETAAPGAASRAFLQLSEGNEIAATGPSTARKVVAALIAALYLLSVPLLWTGAADASKAVRPSAVAAHDGGDDDNSGPGGDDDGDDDTAGTSLGAETAATTGGEDSTQGTAGTSRGGDTRGTTAGDDSTNGTDGTSVGETRGTTGVDDSTRG